MKKLKLKMWVKVVLWLMLLALIIICLIDTITHEERHIGYGYDYTCYGNWIISICNGETYD